MSEQNKPILRDKLDNYRPFALHESQRREGYYPVINSRHGTALIVQPGFDYGMDFGLAVVEALNDRTKDRELIQTLVNSIGKFLDMANDGDVVVYHLEDDQPPPTEQLKSALALAGEQGYQPRNELLDY